MNYSLLVLLGGAVGALLRYWVGFGVTAYLGKHFPFGTLLVNISGSFIMGFLTIYIIEHLSNPDFWRALLLTGFLGGYTTFSSFSIESVMLGENGHLSLMLMNIVSSVIFCLLAAWLGVICARSLV